MSRWPLLISITLSGCEPEQSTMVEEPIFVRGGLLFGGRFEARPWTPGEAVRVGEREVLAPATAECISMYHVPLGDVSRLVAMGGGAPDTALAWSPDGSRLAIGSFLGDVLVVDGLTGDVLARRRLSESLVKQVAWSPDGATLYAGEQSPDALVHALDPASLADRWTIRLADRVGSSPPPAGEDIYAVYNLPAAYTLHVEPDGTLLVGATHGWTDDAQVRHNRSQILLISPTGAVMGAWPETPADAVMLHSRADAGMLVVPVSRSASGPPPEGLPIGGVQILKVTPGSSPDTRVLSPVGSLTVPPLSPWFKDVFIWENLDISVAANTVLVGFGDGRVRLAGLDGSPRVSLDPGVPILAGEVPIAAGANFGRIIDDEAVILTTATTIPWGAASPELRPPSPHPAEHTLRVIGLDGALRWTWHGDQALAGLSLGPDGRTLVVGAGSRDTDTRRDLYGALVFDRGGSPRSGADRLTAWCPTEGPVFFRHAVAPDGRIAVVELPYSAEGGTIGAAWQVTVFR